MKQQLFALSLGIGGLVFAAHQALGQAAPQCAERGAVVAELAARYGETRGGIGLANGNAVMEIFASDDSGTWTITITTAAGLACLLAAGQNFERLAEEPPAAGKGA